MKTEAELKSLAEKAAKFLGAEIGVSSKWPHTYTLEVDNGSMNFEPEDIFQSDYYSPILAHLGKREMRKRKYEMNAGFGDLYYCNFQKKNRKYIPMDYEHDENEFIALWSAIEEAIDAK